MLSDTFTVRLNKAPLVDTKVSLVVNDTTEAEVSVSEIIFTPKNYYKPVTVTVTGADDNLRDGNISTFISISLVGEDQEKTKFVYLENEDNEADMLLVSGITNSRIDADEGVQSTQTVQLEMTYPPDSDTVFVIEENSDNISLNTNTLTFTSDDWNVPQPVTFTLNKPDDEVAGGDTSEDIVIKYINPDTGITEFTKTITVVFTEDDILESLVNSGSGLLYEDTTLTVDISLNKEPVSDVNVSIVSANAERFRCSTC